MRAYKLLVVFTILVTFQEAHNKEADWESCTEFLNLIKKLIKPKAEDENTSASAEVTKKPKTNKFEEKIEKYLEKKFPWWPSKLTEDLGVTEKPTTKATPMDTLVTSYMDFLSNLLKIF